MPLKYSSTSSTVKKMNRSEFFPLNTSNGREGGGGHEVNTIRYMNGHTSFENGSFGSSKFKISFARD